MTTFKVNLKTSQVAAYLNDVPKAVRAAAQAAINSMSPDVRREAAQGISSVYNIKEGVAKRGIKFYARASPLNLRAIWRPEGKAIPLKAFDVRATGGKRLGAHPVSAEVFRGKRKIVQGAFIGVGKRAAKRKASMRTPTRSLYGPGIPQMFAREETTKAMIKVAETVLPRRLDSELVRQLRKLETGKLPPLR